jgi:hypothetical protein
LQCSIPTPERQLLASGLPKLARAYHFYSGDNMKTLMTFGLGALAMYLLDPEHGRRRRSLLRDRLAHAKHVVRERTAGAAASTQLEPDKPSATPEGAHHLGR